MSSSQSLRDFIRERLTAAADEIFTEFDKTIVHYEEELDRQRRLLEICWKPQIKLQRIDLQPKFCRKEEVLTDEQFCNQERDLELDQGEPETHQMKSQPREPELQLAKENKDNLKSLLINENHEEQKHLEMKSQQEESEPLPMKEEPVEPKPQQVKDERMELYISLEEKQLELQLETDSSTAVDDSGVPGTDRVDSLAEYLVELRNQFSLTLSNEQVSNIVGLWQNLLDFDKQKVAFAARHQNELKMGTFRSPKKRQEFIPGVDSLKRHVLTTTAPLAQWPDCCPLVENILIRLCAIHLSPKKKGTGTVSRWDLILEDYRKIRRVVLGNGAVMQQTNLQLVDVSHTTLVQWHNKRLKKQESLVGMQGLNLLRQLSVGADPLPSANMPQTSVPPLPGPPHQYHLPTSTVGQAKVKRKAAAAATPTAKKLPCLRRIFPAAPPPPPSAPQLLMLAPVGSQVPVLFAAPHAMAYPYPTTPVTPAVQYKKLQRKVSHNTCKKCGQYKRAETGHSQYNGRVYCPSAETLPRQQWLEAMKNNRDGP